MNALRVELSAMAVPNRLKREAAQASVVSFVFQNFGHKEHEEGTKNTTLVNAIFITISTVTFFSFTDNRGMSIHAEVCGVKQTTAYSKSRQSIINRYQQSPHTISYPLNRSLFISVYAV